MFLFRLFSFFSSYANSFERKADRFFKHIRASDGRQATERKLGELMQEDLVSLNLWMEKKYKNYVYLKKRVRRKMYKNVEEMKRDFFRFCEKNPPDLGRLQSQFEKLGILFPGHIPEKILHLACIMAYLRPGFLYHYEEASNFGKLLKNPTQEPLIGDCNQIVTLYAYLYSLKFPISDLQIKLLPRHVCLHFQEVDIEATNATFQAYAKFDYLLPITELLSTNLLDVNDEEAKTKKIDERTVVKRAELAYLISSLRDVVDRNLKISYQNLGVSLLNQHRYESAIFYLEKINEPALLQNAYRNATIYYMNQNDFKKARYFARYCGDAELEHSLPYREGVYYYQKKSYNEALPFFKQAGDDRMVKACYQGQYNVLASRIPHAKTLSEARAYRSTYQKLVELAHLAGNEEA
ncbi:MAG: hypothetical protein WCW30_04095, partial [Candidatus Gracilibacteria bacterium]